jgi:hypothetical protein
MLKTQHITHKQNEWFHAVDEDPDCDLETGAYIGLYDMLKLSDGHWYPKNECYYMNDDGERESCMN